MSNSVSQVRRTLSFVLLTLIITSAAFAVPALSAAVPEGEVRTAAQPEASQQGGQPEESVVVASGSIIINEVMFKQAQGSFQWVELKNAGAAAVQISGYGITDEDGHWYRIPNALPAVPAGAFVVVIFDGKGAATNDYNLSDNKATLHTQAGLTNPFEAACDQCALYKQSYGAVLPLVTKNYRASGVPLPQSSLTVALPPVVDFVAWGCNPTTDASSAVRAGVWLAGTYVTLSRGLGDESADASLATNESIALIPGRRGGSPGDWCLFQAAEASPGAENQPGLVSWYYPPDGATVDGATFTIEWAPVAAATGYHFKLDDTANMSSPLIDRNLTEPVYMPTAPVAQGAYFWQVQPLFAGRQGQWTPILRINALTLPAFQASAQAAAYKSLGIAWQLQHKDTRMLCLDGDPETGDLAWDKAHNARGTHGNRYCARASLSMIASYYGGRLSQDRITYQIFKGNGHSPEGELGHDMGVNLDQQNAAIAWALGVAINPILGKPTFAQIKAWIDADRPIYSRITGHVRVCDGYFEFTAGPITWQFVHILDPWDRAQWVNYADDPVNRVHVGPPGANGAPNVRSDEDEDRDGTPDTKDDSDGDGVVDFDERYRFKGFLNNLDPLKADSDADGLTDKLDMREYLFDPVTGYRHLTADFDHDGDRKETDPDNDSFFNETSRDGCEDTNRNGAFDTGESSNFDARSERECLTVEITSPAPGSSAPDTVVAVAGKVTSQFDLTALTIQVIAGTQSNSFEASWTGTKPNFTFSQDVPLFAGRNTIKVTAESTMGPASATIEVTCTSGVRDILVQLSWPLLGSDVDLHFIRPGGAYWDTTDDCHWRNENPDWGVPGDPTDNPSLDIDCISQCTVENIVLNRPVNGAYQVKVHYYSDHGMGPTRPTVRIWVQGRGYSFGPREMTSDSVWDVATIQWPSMTVLVTDQIHALGEEPVPVKPD